MSKALLSMKFSEVEARRASPKTVQMDIREVIKANEDACWEDMKRYLIAPGVTGRKQWDQAYAMEILLQHDKKLGGTLTDSILGGDLTYESLWTNLQRVLVKAGYKLQRGFIVDLLESPEERRALGVVPPRVSNRPPAPKSPFNADTLRADS